MKQNDLNTEQPTFDKIKRKRGRPKKIHLDDLLDRTIDEHDDLLDYDHHEGKNEVVPEEIIEAVIIEPKLSSTEEKKRYYVDTERLELLIKNYYETGFITDELATCLSNIANRLAYMPNFLNYCVDVETEALTQRGWLKHDEITTNDIILSYDVKDATLKWSKIKDIYKSIYTGKMHKLDVRGLDALVTPNHKFVSLEKGLKPVEEITSKEHIILTGLPVSCVNKKHTDDFVKLVGWCVTEGNYNLGKKTHGIIIFQKEGYKSDIIRTVFKNLDIHHKEYDWSCKNNIIGFSFNKHYAHEVIRVAPNKILSMDFILELTQEQKLILIETMLNGDGWIRRNDDKILGMGYVQKDKKHMDNFSILCTLAGFTYSVKYTKNKSEYGYGSYYYTLNLHITPKQYCKGENIDFHGGKSKAGGLTGKKNHPNTPTYDYNGIIWCPNTEYGTFVCRRGMYTYVTGNTWREEMIGDGLIKEFLALKNKKYDPAKGKAFSYFTQIVYNAFRNRIKNENKEHQALREFQDHNFEALTTQHQKITTNEYDTHDNF